jgi:hypothetical protein
MTPRSRRTQPEKMENSEDLARKVLNLARQGASSNSERNWQQGSTCKRGKDLEDSGTNAGRRRPRTGPKWAQAGRRRPAGPARFEAQSAPFDLDASRAIYSPPDRESRINQFVIRRRRAEKLEGHHLGDEGRASCLGSP